MKITRSGDVEWVDAIDRGNFRGRRKPLGGQKLTAGMWELPPGKKSFPLHMHHVTEEALFVISGHAKVRTQEGEHEIGPGDYVSFPPGGPAHQLVNHGTEPLVYLAMSATQGHDIVEYPDSGKVAAAVGSSPGGKRFVFRQKDQAEYWDGEE
jgi:uncharacterized cupin superfamily protein